MYMHVCNFCFDQHAKEKCLLRPGLGTLQSAVKVYLIGAKPKRIFWSSSDWCRLQSDWCLSLPLCQRSI
jgi:hypothetical protein